jgi:hypothetical protein
MARRLDHELVELAGEMREMRDEFYRYRVIRHCRARSRVELRAGFEQREGDLASASRS